MDSAQPRNPIAARRLLLRQLDELAAKACNGDLHRTVKFLDFALDVRTGKRDQRGQSRSRQQPPAPRPR